MIKNLFRYIAYFFVLTLLSCSSDSDEDTLPTKPDANAIINIDSDGENTLLFDERVMGRESVQIVTIENTGDAPLEISNLELPNGFTSDWIKSNISAKSSKNLTLTFSPNEIKSFEGDINIVSNAVSGKNTLAIKGQGVNEIYEGNIILNSQEVIEKFALIGYTAIAGNLCLSANCEYPFTPSNIQSLSPLIGLTSVKQLRISNNPLLETLSGIDNIKVEEYFSMHLNPLLKNIDEVKSMPFNVLTQGLSITDNASLENIDGLIKFNSCGSYITINGNESLQNIDGFANLISAKELGIHQSPLLTNLNGLRKLELIQARLSITRNKSLYDFCGIKMVLETSGVGGEFTTYDNRYNPSMAEIVNGECSREIPLDTYHGEKRFLNQIVLDGFLEAGFTKIEGKAIIGSDYATDDVKSIEALSKLSEITGGLVIQNNTELTSLTGLNNLIKVTSSISIVNNTKLNDYCGLVPLFQTTGGVTGTVEIKENLFNPTVANLEAGTCK